MTTDISGGPETTTGTESRAVDHERWLAARLELLEAEKAFTRERDALTMKRRSMPWERVSKAYEFISADGPVDLKWLFDGRSQLIVYHFMFGRDWSEGCKSCSFWADNFEGIPVHLRHRDVSFVAISRAPIEKLMAYRSRMGWTFPWVSSGGSDFNYDFQVSFTAEQLADGEACYGYRTRPVSISDEVGISVFALGSDGQVYHTYSTYDRGVDMLNGAYHYLDLVPKGRDEAGLDHPMQWLRRHDQY